MGVLFMTTISASPMRSAISGDSVVGRAVIDRQLAELFQLSPAQIAGIFRIPVQYYNFHVCSLLSTSYLRLPHYFIIDIQLCMAQRFNISLRKSCLCRV